MHRAIAVPRHISATVGRDFVRTSRRVSKQIYSISVWDVAYDGFNYTSD